MTDDQFRTAAKQALEALEAFMSDELRPYEAAKTAAALRAALAEDALQRLTDVSQEIEAALAAPQNPCNPSCAPGYCYCEPVQEPVAWRVRRNDGQYELYFVKASAERAAECYIKRPQVEPLYATPPQRKPLTEEEIRAIMRSLGWDGEAPSDLLFARAVEAAHGIKEGT